MATKKAKKKQIKLSKSQQIIASFYIKHFTLLSYLYKVKQGTSIRLIQDGDLPEYRVLLKSTLVGVPRDRSATPPFKPNHAQWFTFKEIINRVIEHACRSKKTMFTENVIASGFEAFEWNVSMFVKVNSQCFFQVTGFPISRLIPLKPGESVTPQLHSKQAIPSIGGGDGSNAVLKKKTKREGKQTGASGGVGAKAAVLKRETTRRGGKRATKYHEKIRSQKKKEDLSDMTGKSNQEVPRLDVESVHVIAATASSPAVSSIPDQIDQRNNRNRLDACSESSKDQGKRKRESCDNVNGKKQTEEHSHAKKARITCNVDEIFPSSFFYWKLKKIQSLNGTLMKC
ncbi:hypothetical protein OS493_012304 [Desmophyllum pertusum]|uniref:Telomerase reverse transcriptase n=1 Tax=Desmophyllum pertusum TaxID=174260 RepID=A0A9W9ZQA4_9CNID|nr:hypothetical protein OS493_012304 [Desmophyllum pertusum]